MTVPPHCTPDASDWGMKKVRQQTHLVKRNGVYWYRQKIPIDLIEHDQRASGELRFSLKTKDQADAVTLAAAHTMRVNEEFRSIREFREEQDNPRPKLTPIDPAIIPQLARAAFNRAMMKDEHLRFQGLEFTHSNAPACLDMNLRITPGNRPQKPLEPLLLIGINCPRIYPFRTSAAKAAGYGFGQALDCLSAS